MSEELMTAEDAEYVRELVVERRAGFVGVGPRVLATYHALAAAREDSAFVDWMQNNPNFALTIRDNGTATIFTNTEDFDGENFRDALRKATALSTDAARRGTE